MKKEYKYLLAILFILIMFSLNWIVPENKQVQYTIENSSVSTQLILSNNISVICHTGYSSTVRNVPLSLRKEVFARDGVEYPQPTGRTELDHIIPLCLGGSNDADNLFVQFDPEFHDKDKLEVYLCKNVCLGNIDINYAQRRIYENWSAYYEEIYG